MRSGADIDKALAAIAALLIAAAALMTFLGAGRTLAMADDFKKKRSQRLELLALQARLARGQSALAAFNTLADAAPADPARLAAEALDGATPRQREMGFTSLADGWTARRIELEWAEIPLDKAWTFLVRAESNRPPWRLAEYRFTAEPGRPGSGRLAVVLEALEKAR